MIKKFKSRTIDAYPKQTAAKTQYYDIDPDDEAYIYQWLYRIMADMNEQTTWDEELRRDWFKRRPGTLPKGEFGPNSYASILGGICSAKLQDSRKNLSAGQLDAVEMLFGFIAQYYSDEKDAPSSVVFSKKIFRIDN
jgi:hypothetical protein